MTGRPLRDEQRARKPRLYLQQAAQRALDEWERLRQSHDG